MIYYIKKKWKRLKVKQNWWKIKRKTKKQFKVIRDFKKVTNKRYKFKSLRWFSKRNSYFKKFWQNYISVSMYKKFKTKSKAQTENLWFKQRQTTKHILFFDFVFNRQLDILIATFFGGTLSYVRKMILKREVLVNGQSTLKVTRFISFGDFIQIEPPTYLSLLKYKHYLFRWKKNQYRGYLLNINLLGLLFNRSLNVGVLFHFKIWQPLIRRQDRWQTRLKKDQSKLGILKNTVLFSSR